MNKTKPRPGTEQREFIRVQNSYSNQQIETKTKIKRKDSNQLSYGTKNDNRNIEMEMIVLGRKKFTRIINIEKRNNDDLPGSWSNRYQEAVKLWNQRNENITEMEISSEKRGKLENDSYQIDYQYH